MGLIKKAIDVVKGTLKDQYQTAIRCEDMGNDLLLAKKTKQNGIIRNGSIIIVNPGQLAVLIDNGKVVDAAAEAGAYEWQSDASPGFFSGDFGGMFQEMWRRFAFGGATYQDQAVYYINAKEITGNHFGTPEALLCASWLHKLPNEFTGEWLPTMIKIKGTGNYTFTIKRPDIFMSKIGGTASLYFKDELIDQMRSEVVEKFQLMLNTLMSDADGCRVSPFEITKKGDDIKDMMKKGKFDMNIEERGIEINALVIESIKLDDESEKAIKEYQAMSTARSFNNMLHARGEDTKRVVGSNEAGLGVGFLGIGMMNQMMGQGTVGSTPPPAQPFPQQPFPQQPFPQQPMPQQPMPQQPFPQQPMPQQPASGVAVATPPPAAGGLPCTSCGQPVVGKFCANCGAAAPAPAAPVSRFCIECGAKADAGKFCAECGTPFA